MIRAHLSRLRRGLKNEDGSAAVEFVLIFPVIATLIVMTMDMGLITLRQTLLDRGLDMAVREVRLGTGAPPQHDQIKDLICENAFYLGDCDADLYLEMVPTTPRSFNALHDITSCTDQPVESRPVRGYTPGQENEIVLMRACVLYKPVFPKGLLPRMLASDINGNSAIVSMTAFVQEPT